MSPSPFDKLLSVMLRPWVAACYLSFVVMSFFYFDQPIAWFFYNLDLKAKLPVLYWLTKLGTGEFYVVALLMVVLFFRYIRPDKTKESRSLFLWLCVLVPYVICGFLKVILGRARPELLFDSQLYGFYGLHLHPEYWSFPSGHTTTIMGLVFGFIVLFPRYCYAFLCVGLMIVSTRVLLTNHYLSDVMTTSYLTLLEVGFMVSFLRRKSWLTSAYRQMNSTAVLL